MLWIWAALVFTVVDLFRNVPEFDRVRPDWGLYRGMRVAAHRMVGEPIADGDVDVAPTGREAARPGPLADAGALRASLAAATLASSAAELETLAVDGPDPRVRIHALRLLAERFGAEARPTLLQVIDDRDEADTVRRQATRFLGRTGGGALETLERVLAADLPERVRCGAVDALGDLATAPAARRALQIAAGPPSRMRGVATDALARMGSAEAAPLLESLVADRTVPLDIRAAACRGLGSARCAAAVNTLTSVLGDDSHLPVVRAAAAESLGRIGDPRGRAAVTAACGDWDAGVVRAARLARTRLDHVR